VLLSGLKGQSVYGASVQFVLYSEFPEVTGNQLYSISIRT